MDLQNKIHAEYGKLHQWPRLLGIGADGLFDARICMAKAYAAVNRWHDADCDGAERDMRVVHCTLATMIQRSRSVKRRTHCAV
jgi:hypothetical protein